MAVGNGSFHYSVAFPKPLLDQLRVWAEEAKQLGVGAEFLAAMQLGVGAEFLAAIRDMNRRLKTDPTKWGDPLQEYETIDAAELRGMVPKWLLIWYGVHDPARQVIVRSLLPAPGSPLSHPSPLT